MRNYSCFIFSAILLIFCLPLNAWKGSSFQKFASTKWLKSIGVISSILFSSNAVLNNPTSAFGPVDVELQITDYHRVDLCNGRKPALPGQKAAEGLYPICIEVEADVFNPEKSKTLTDVSIYGFVKEDAAGNSVLANNPDFKSDSGQYAMIAKIPPGKSHVTYQFVAAISTDPKEKPIPKLTFFKTKAVSFPGGEKFRPLDICELDPNSCDNEDDE